MANSDFDRWVSGSLPFFQNFEIQVAPLSRRPEDPVQIRILRPLRKIKAHRQREAKMPRRQLERLIDIETCDSAFPASRYLAMARLSGKLLLGLPMRAPIKGAIAFFMRESAGRRRKRFDLALLLGWAGIAIALWILLAIR
jgi:hypothetical protein